MHSLSWSTCPVIWLRNFFMGIKMIDSISRLIKVYSDNNATVFYSRNKKTSSSSKHIDFKCYIVLERIKYGYGAIERINNQDIITI